MITPIRTGAGGRDAFATSSKRLLAAQTVAEKARKRCADQGFSVRYYWWMASIDSCGGNEGCCDASSTGASFRKRLLQANAADALAPNRLRGSAARDHQRTSARHPSRKPRRNVPALLPYGETVGARPRCVRWSVVRQPLFCGYPVRAPGTGLLPSRRAHAASFADDSPPTASVSPRTSARMRR